MSRRQFPAGNGIVCFVGWDRPLQSYFAQVHGVHTDPAQEEKLQPFRDMGYGANLTQTVSTVEELEAALEGASIRIPSEIREQLVADKGPDEFPNRIGRGVVNALRAR